MFAIFQGAMRYLLTTFLLLVLSIPARAQSSPDFLFGRPQGSVSLRGGWVLSRAGSDWYNFVQDQLTIDKGAFNAAGVGFDVGVALTPRLDVLGGVDFNKATVNSEYRQYVDNNRLPIAQTTDLRGANISASLKYALLPRGREVGRLAWVQRSVVPFVGGGGGFYWYRLQQTGDFVDFVDLSVFTDRFESSGWTPSAHLFGGADIKVYRRLYVTMEARYVWAAARLGSGWIDFDPIDLSGLRMSSGISVVF